MTPQTHQQLTPAMIHFKMVSEITAYDRRQSTKRGYNMFALPIMIGAAQEASKAIESGKPARAAIVDKFCGRLLDRILKVIGEAPSTDADQRMKW